LFFLLLECLLLLVVAEKGWAAATFLTAAIPVEVY